MIKPTIGRRVWYWPNSFDSNQMENPRFLFWFDKSQPLDAGIAYVHNDSLVNLSVSDQIGCAHSRVTVRLLQDDDLPNEGEAYAQWMPYQVAQAGIKPVQEPESSVVETKEYSDGAVATGVAPIPEVSPVELVAEDAHVEVDPDPAVTYAIADQSES